MGRAEALHEDPNVPINIGPGAPLLRPIPTPKGQLCGGPCCIFSCPSWETTDDAAILGLEVWLPFQSVVPRALPPSYTPHQPSPHSTLHTTPALAFQGPPESPAAGLDGARGSAGPGGGGSPGRAATQSGESRGGCRVRRAPSREPGERACPPPRPPPPPPGAPRPAPRSRALGAPFAERLTLVARRTAPQRPGWCAARLP